jgi:hypothetical protein
MRSDDAENFAASVGTEMAGRLDIPINVVATEAFTGSL